MVGKANKFRPLNLTISLAFFKKIFKLTHNTILLNTKNNGPFHHFQQSSKILTYLSNHIAHLIVSSLNLTMEKIQTTKSNNFIGHNIYSAHLHKSLFNTLCILLH
jgi:hypothetical protein